MTMLLGASLTTCISASNGGNDKETHILIHTTMGDIKVKLYDQTPKTRDNFIKLVKSKFYDSTLFHRVIKEFMIQAGDPQSKHAAPGVMLGNGDAGYTVPAEIVPGLYHKKGALAMARQGDNVNPTKASSGCQFYIVQGKPCTNEQLNQIEGGINNGVKVKIFNDLIKRPENAELLKKFMQFQNANQMDSMNQIAQKFYPAIDSIYAKSPHFSYTPEQKQVYSTLGGAPFLDNNYTVFGEVIDGLDVVDKIAAVQTATGDRPVQDVRILSMEVVK